MKLFTSDHADMVAPTLRQLADEAGVSLAAMSQALNGTGHLAQATRTRLLALLQRRGYVAQPALAALAARRRQPRNESLLPVAVFGATCPIYARLQPLLRQSGYHAHPCSDLDEATALALGVAGAVVLPGGAGEITWTQVPVVRVMPADPGIGGHQVDIDPFAEVVTALRRMHALGFRRIAVAPHQHAPVIAHDDARLGAIFLAQRELVLAAIPPFLGRHGDVDGMLAWCRAQQPDAVLAFNAFALCSLREALPGMPGAALAISSQLQQHAQLAGIRHDDDALADAAVTLLDQAVRQQHRAPPHHARRLVVAGTWHDGPSLI